MKFKIFGKWGSKYRPTDKPARFRILIVGKANTGKTSILKKLCDVNETPIVHDTNGKQIQIDHDPTLGRGVHDVEHEITYPSRPMFVFHDSRGFEAGSVAEMDLLKTFIVRRCSLADVSQQVHVIWYCISGDDERPLLPAELRFFEIDTGKVPVIAIFTKCDALEIKAYSTLRNVDGLSEDEAEAAAPAAAAELFQKHFLPRLKETQKPPASHVCLRGMFLPLNPEAIGNIASRSS
jgi:GTP-binding protein EngB required for normal cell division